jgi:hypothetical protein
MATEQSERQSTTSARFPAARRSRHRPNDVGEAGVARLPAAEGDRVGAVLAHRLGYEYSS